MLREAFKADRGGSVAASPGVTAGLWAALFDPETLPASAHAGELARLAALTDWRRVPADTLVFHHDEPASGLLALCEGDVALGLQRAGGDFRVDRHLRGPAWLELASGWLGSTLSQDALALSDAVVMSLPRTALFEWADSAPALWPLLGAALARELGVVEELCHELMHKDAPARFASWLHRQLPRTGVAQPRATIVLPTSKRDLASQLAITPETLSRLMRRFSDEGLIRVSGYALQVLDPAGLRQVAEGTAPQQA